MPGLPLYTCFLHACTALGIEDTFEEFGLAAVKTEVKCEGQCMCGYDIVLCIPI